MTTTYTTETIAEMLGRKPVSCWTFKGDFIGQLMPIDEVELSGLVAQLLARVKELETAGRAEIHDLAMALTEAEAERDTARNELTAAQAKIARLKEDRSAMLTELEGLRYSQMFSNTNVGDD
jgi:hypothetical protein